MVFTFLTNSYHSQSTIWGQYTNKDGAFRSLDLKPDHTYNYKFGDRCGGTYIDSGMYTIILDTLFLKSNDTSHKPLKFFYISQKSFDNNNFSYWEIGALAEIYTRDSILPKGKEGKISDYEGLFFGSYVKDQGYYSNNKLMFKIETLKKTKVVTNYYVSGQMKSIEQFYKDKKVGDWYFFKENGQLQKIETYKRNKSKRKKKNKL